MLEITGITEKYFDGLKCTTRKNLAALISGIMQSGQASPYAAAQAMSNVNGRSFRTNEKACNRLLKDKNFQIDDSTFRGYINLLFDAMRESHLVSTGDTIQINVDYTTERDNFLILVASLNFCGRAMVVYFSMRRYPKKKYQISQKKMEEAFIKELRHLLPKIYNYTIVADRGFGNQRFMHLCEASGFDYVLRTTDNLLIKRDGKEIEKLDKYKGKNISFDAEIQSCGTKQRLEIKTEAGSTWFLIMPLGAKNGAKRYEKRFSIEKYFQDQESSGFNIEQTKIEKYDRFKRLYFTMCCAQLLTVICGAYIESKDHPLKKNFPVMAAMVAAFSSSGFSSLNLHSLK